MLERLVWRFNGTARLIIVEDSWYLSNILLSTSKSNQRPFCDSVPSTAPYNSTKSLLI